MLLNYYTAQGSQLPVKKYLENRKGVPENSEARL